MKLAVYPAEGVFTLVIKPAIQEMQTKHPFKVVDVQRPVMADFPGEMVHIITADNASKWGFDSLAHAIELITGSRQAGVLFDYSFVLEEGQWLQKPVPLMTYREVCEELKTRVGAKQKSRNPMKETVAKEALTYLRKVAKQSVSNEQYQARLTAEAVAEAEAETVPSEV